MTDATQAGADPDARGRFWCFFLGRPRLRRDHTDALDGLRGMAVLIVLASHLSNTGLLPRPGLSGTGKSGVYLFFVLSAFLLTRALLQRPLAEFANPWRWADYALRRVLRIWPLYLFVLLLSWFLTRQGVAGWHYQMDDAALLGHLLLREGQSVLWSIPVEFVFYLWLPFVALALAWMQASGQPAWLEMGVVAVAVALATWLWPPGETLPNDVRLGPYLVVFLCGAYAARLHMRMQVSGWGLPVWAWPTMALVALAAWVLVIPSVWAWVLGRPYTVVVGQTWFVFHGLLWAVLLLAVLHGPDALRKPFEWAPMRLSGVVSFSLYLWHMPVLDALHQASVARPLLAPWLVGGSAMLVAMVSFALFERPWREVRLRLKAPPSS